MCEIITMIPKNCTIAERKFKCGRLEYWWIAFDYPQFYPHNRKHIKGGWFWRVGKGDEYEL